MFENNCIVSLVEKYFKCSGNVLLLQESEQCKMQGKAGKYFKNESKNETNIESKTKPGALFAMILNRNGLKIRHLNEVHLQRTKVNIQSLKYIL